MELPAIGFAVAFAGIALAGIDFRLADAVFYDATTQTWIGAHTWWADDLIHGGGLDLVRSIVSIAALVYAASWYSPRARELRRDAGYVLLAIGVATGVVGALKQLTHIACPWDLADYGGTHVFAALLGPRPADAGGVACFPGAHASGGFALMCFYFVLRDRRPRAARVSLLLGILTGVVFALGQEARGAHFLSHDLASAAIVWFVQLALYVAAPPLRRSRSKSCNCRRPSLGRRAAHASCALVAHAARTLPPKTGRARGQGGQRDGTDLDPFDHAAGSTAGGCSIRRRARVSCAAASSWASAWRSLRRRCSTSGAAGSVRQE